MNRLGRSLAWLVVMAWIFSCDSYRVGRLVQSGRQALLRKDFEAALSHFEKAARKAPRYIFEAAHFKEGIWTYVGRTQYATGRYAEARQSLGLALSTHEQDRLARLYLGLVLLRGGSELQGLAELRTGMQDLHDWIDYIVNSRVNEPYWDPNQQIRGELKKSIAWIAEQSRDRAQLVASAEWIGQQVEQEIDRVRREESRNR